MIACSHVLSLPFTQEDSFLPQLTVREALQFAGRLLLPPPYCAPAAVAARAAAVAGALGLGRRLDNVIGGVLPGGILLRGLSGGERKRLNIGQGAWVGVARTVGLQVGGLGHAADAVVYKGAEGKVPGMRGLAPPQWRARWGWGGVWTPPSKGIEVGCCREASC